ncbi:MAG: hypothetical protein WCP87_00310 [Atribacterota bacterium]
MVKRVLLGIGIGIFAITLIAAVAFASDQEPKRYFLDFTSASLVHEPSTGVLQIIAEGSVLSYGQDWEIIQLKPYLYHLKKNSWKGFFWKVNTTRKEAYEVTQGTFGQLGGVEKIIPFTIEVTGGTNDAPPKRFFLRFHHSYLVHEPTTGILQIIAEGYSLSYGQDWQVYQLKPYLYHLKKDTWRDFFWVVNTSRKEAYRVTGGTFSQLGGEQTRLNITVRVVEE